MACRLNHAIGNYESALSFGLEAKKSAIAQYKKNSPQHVTSLNDIGAIYNTQGNYEEAEFLFSKALKICKKELQENYPK